MSGTSTLRFFGRRPLLWAALVGLLIALPAEAQSPSPREELLRLIPPDTGFCLIVNDLRGRAAAIGQTSWLKRFLSSSLGKKLLASPEAAELAKFQKDLKDNFHVDLAQLRDDIVGDAFLLAYRPGVAESAREEDGLILLWARNAELLTQLIDRLNEIQAKSDPPTTVTPVIYEGKKYYRREEPEKTHYYFVDGPVLAFSSKEELIRSVIERRGRKASQSAALVKQLKNAGAERSLVTVWLNPRAFDSDLRRKAKQALGQEAHVLQSFLSYWQALDAVILTADAGFAIEARLCLQARFDDLPKPARRLFDENITRSELWLRFPADSIMRVAGRLNAPDLADTLSELTPPAARAALSDAGQRYLAASLGVDLVKDVLPNIGPDWGVCVFSGPEQNEIPFALAALAVQPGKVAVDQAIYKGARLAAGLLVWGYNSSHSNPIRLETKTLDGVEVNYLTNDQDFPRGFQPAFALKDGYFLIASSPVAIRSFKKTASSPNAISRDVNPILHVSMRELAKSVKAHRVKLVDQVSVKNHIDPAVAHQWLDNLLMGLSLFDDLLFSERRAPGQITWSLRLRSSLRTSSGDR